LTSRIVVDQAKGFVSQRLDVSVDNAFALLRLYARTHGHHLTELSRRLIAEPEGGQTILAAMMQMVGPPPS
jgi:AmiR/NasT family two-component response regulator